MMPPGSRITVRPNLPRFVVAFSLVEVLVSLGITSLLAVLLLVAVQKVSTVGASSKCLSNLRQLHTASISFAQDHDGCVPQHFQDWTTEISPKASAVGDGFDGGGIAPYIYPERMSWAATQQLDYRNTVFQDPGAKAVWIDYKIYSGQTVKPYLGALKSTAIPNPGGVEYARNNEMGAGDTPLRLANLPRPSRFFLYVCSSQWNIAPDVFISGNANPERLAPRHSGGYNMIFADGHALSTALRPGDPEFSSLLLKLNQQR